MGAPRDAWHAAIEQGAEVLRVRNGGALHLDQEALRLMLHHRIDTPGVPPYVLSATPGHAFSALQRASVEAFCREGEGYAPTRREATAAAREALRSLKALLASTTGGNEDAVSSVRRHSEEARRLREHGRDPKPSTLSPADLAARGGLKLTPTAPCVLPPYRPAPVGHVPLADGHGLLRLHQETCADCAASRDCWIWPYCKSVLEGIGIDWIDDMPPPPSDPAGDRSTRPRNGLPELVRKWEERGVLADCSREQLDIPSYAFVNESVSFPLEADVEASIRDDVGGSGITLIREATRRADTIASTYARAISGESPPSRLRVGSANAAVGGLPASNRQCLAELSDAYQQVSPAVKLRMILAAHEVNEHAIPTHFAYERVDQFLARVGPGWYIAKCDIASFFYAFPLSEASSRRFGFAVAEDTPTGSSIRYKRFLRLPMGFRSAPLWACLASAIVFEALRARLRRGAAAAGFSLEELAELIYVDDGVLGAKTKRALAFLMKTLRECLDAAGLAVAEDKTTQFDGDDASSIGAQREVALGVEITTVPRVCATLPPDKLVTTLTLLGIVRRVALDRVPFPKEAIAEAVGRLNWALEILPRLAPFTRALVSYSYGDGGLERWGNEEKRLDVIDDVDALLEAASWGGWSKYAIHERPEMDDNRFLRLTTDASGHGSVAVVFENEVGVRFRLPQADGMQVPDLETLPRPLIIDRYGPMLKGWRLKQASDAQGAVYWAWRLRASSKVSNDLLAFTSRLEDKLDIRWTTTWLSRYGLFSTDRLASEVPLEELRNQGAQLPLFVDEVSLAGLPCEFLSSAEVEPFRWHLKAWRTRREGARLHSRTA